MMKRLQMLLIDSRMTSGAGLRPRKLHSRRFVLRRLFILRAIFKCQQTENGNYQEAGD